MIKIAMLCCLGLLATANAAENVYYAQKNDTLSRLSVKLLRSFRRWPELAAYNQLKPPYLVREGQMIRYEGLLQQPVVGSPVSTPSPVSSVKAEPPALQTVIPVRIAPSPVPQKDLLLFEKIHALVKAEKCAEALPLLEKLSIEKPEHVSIGFLQIRCHLTLKDESSARGIGEAMLKIHPEYQNLPLFLNQLKITAEPKDTTSIPGGAN